jgi:hypothetical protein
MIWRHRPPQGIVLFFDVKVIAGKAYGGRRYTTAKQLVLARQQQTRGKFALFLLYEVNRGRTHWAFRPGKSSNEGCQFMQRIRRWYPAHDVWVALGQDRSHPCKSRQTRRTMRALKLHGMSLPKGSPDDNPVETLFSDIQWMILDNSNEPAARTTPRRISAHLRGRNRRRDRMIHIPYLSDTHKI